MSEQPLNHSDLPQLFFVPVPARPLPVEMGLALSALRQLFRKKEVRILFHGLDAAGKTTALYRMKLGEVVTTIPTIGFNVETVEHKNISITAWDVGGRDKIRPLWRHYYQNTDGMVFVVDSNDVERMEIARDELHKILREDELRDIPLLIFCNKQDLPNAMPPAKITEQLGLLALRGRTWHVQGCCATSGDGLIEGLDWLSDNMASRMYSASQQKETTKTEKVAKEKVSG